MEAAKRKKPKYLNTLFPFLVWWPLVNSRSLMADFMAGITGAVIVLPQGVAFAIIAGLPPIYGLYSAMVIPVIVALFGSSWHMVSGPTTALSIVIFASLSPHADPGSPDFIRLVLTLTLMTGAFQFIFGLAKMGTWVNFVSHTVVIGFTAGAAVLIATSQIEHLLGLEIPQTGGFVSTWEQIFLHLGQTNFYVLAVGLFTLLIVVLFRVFLPKWPNMLIAMLLGSVLSLLIQGEVHGVKLVGEIPAGLPPFGIPDLSTDTLRLLVGDALALALLGLIEAVAIARSIAVYTHQRIDGNQEFIGQGLSNVIGSFFSCYAGSGSFTRSGVNHQAGAKTPLSSIFSAILLVLIVLLVAPYAAYLPIPAMAGIILFIAYKLIDIPHIRGILKASRRETAILAVTFFATLFLDLEFAIYAGVLLSLIFYLQQTARPNISVIAPNPEVTNRKFTQVDADSSRMCPQLNMMSIEGVLFFGSTYPVASFLGALREEGGEHLLIVATGISMIDLAGAEFLAQEVEQWRAQKGEVYICGLDAEQTALLKKLGIWAKIGEDHFFDSKSTALTTIVPKLNPEICATCTSRIFLECPPPTH